MKRSRRIKLLKSLEIFWIKNQIYIIEVGIIAISLIIGFITYCFVKEAEVILAFIGGGISLSLGIRQYRIENDSIFKELFKEFNNRYNSEFNDALNNIDRYCKSSGNEPDKEIKEGLIIDYLNFCSEEYLWYTRNRIPKSVWQSWENGMVYFINLKPINEIALQQKDQMTSFYGLWDKIGERIDNWNE